MANIIPLKDNTGAQFYPQTHEKAVIDSNGVNLQTKLQSITTPTYVTAWDGASTPVVANIPAGVTVTYNTTSYTGTLAASASTANKTYLVSTGTTDNYNRYVTQLNGSTYSWQNLGSTEIDLSDYATKAELNQLDQKVTIEGMEPLAATVVAGLSPWGNNKVLALDAYTSWYIPVSVGMKFEVTTANDSTFRAGYTEAVPAANATLLNYEAIGSETKTFTSAVNGYFVIGAKTENNPTASFKVTVYSDLKETIVGKPIDMSTLNASDGAYNMSGTIAWTGSTFYHTAPLAVKAGDKVNLNNIKTTASISMISEVTQAGTWVANIFAAPSSDDYTGQVTIQKDCYISISGYGNQNSTQGVAVIISEGLYNRTAENTRKLKAIDLLQINNSANIADASIFTKVGYWNYNKSFVEDSQYRTSGKIMVVPNTTYYIRNGINYIAVAEFDITGNILKVTNISSPSSASFTTLATTSYIEIGVRDIYVSSVCVGLASGADYTRGFSPVLARPVSPVTAVPAKTYDILNTWRGKSFMSLGDSVTARDQWQKIVDFYLGTSHINKGITGNSIGRYVFEYNAGTTVANALISSSDLQGADLIIIASYINSALSQGPQAELGSLDDTFIEITEEAAQAATSVDDYSKTITAQNFTQAARSAIEYVLKNCGTVPVIIVGDLQFAGSENYGVDDFEWENNAGFNRRDFAKRMGEIAALYGLPYVDLEVCGGVNAINASEFSDDNIHPNFTDFNGGDNWPDCGMRKFAMPIIRTLLGV